VLCEIQNVLHRVDQFVEHLPANFERLVQKPDFGVIVFDLHEVEEFDAEVPVVVPVFVVGLQCNCLVVPERHELVDAAVLHDDLAVQDRALSLHILLDLLFQEGRLNGCGVVAVA